MNNDNVQNLNMDALLTRGKFALEDREFQKAAVYFDKVLYIDAECAKAYLGLALCDFNAADLFELEAKYNVNAFKINGSKMSMFEDNSDRINAIVEAVVQNNEVENYLDRQQIYMALNFDFTYTSTVAAWMDIKKKNLEQLYANKNLKRAMQSGTEIKEQVQKMLDQVKKGYDDKIQAAVEQDRQTIEQRLGLFELFAQEKAEVMHSQAIAYRENDYAVAMEMFENKDYSRAKRLFSEDRLGGYKLSADYYQLSVQARKKRIKKYITTVIAVVAVVAIIVLTLVIAKVISRSVDYNKAMKLFNNGDFKEAAEIFLELKDYEDSENLYKRCMYNYGVEMYNNDNYKEAIEGLENAKGYKNSGSLLKMACYNYAEQCFENGEYEIAAVEYGKAGTYLDAREKSFEIWNENIKTNNIAAGYNHTVAITEFGYVRSTELSDTMYDYGQTDVGEWQNIVSVDAKWEHTVGLKSDGTVVVAGNHRCDVSDWCDVIEIAAQDNDVVALKNDGTILTTEYGDPYEDWENIVSISCGSFHTLGLKSDGTVVADGLNSYGACDVTDWKDIVAISAGWYHSVGLKADGTVVANKFIEEEDREYEGQCDVEGWEDIVAVSAGDCFTAGLKSDGRVVIAGGYSDLKKAEKWKNIVEIEAGGRHLIGITANGTVFSAGMDWHGQCDVSIWSNIKLPNTPKTK